MLLRVSLRPFLPQLSLGLKLIGSAWVSFFPKMSKVFDRLPQY